MSSALHRSPTGCALCACSQKWNSLLSAHTENWDPAYLLLRGGPCALSSWVFQGKTPLINDPSAWSMGLLQLKGCCMGHSTLHGIQQLGAVTAALASDQPEEVPWPALHYKCETLRTLYFWGKNIYIFVRIFSVSFVRLKQGSLHLFQFSPAGTLIHAEEQISVSPWGWQINWSPLERRSMYVNFGPDPTWGIFFLLCSPCSVQLLRLYCKWPVWIKKMHLVAKIHCENDFVVYSLLLSE